MVHPGESSNERLAQYGGVQRLPYEKLDLFQRKAFLPPELCAKLIDLIEAGRRPSTLADHNGDDYFRTSETCDLDAGDPSVERLEAMLEELSGIDPTYGEPVQGQRYDIGQEFKAHVDWFNPQGQDWEKYCSVAGQRTWTFMIYLNDVEAGGATRFKMVRKSFKPETGKLLCWDNRKPDLTGSKVGNVNTMHHGMKVRRGLKYVITKWYRERPWGW
ncbi:prolyl hydroxylase family protein [Parerythrobacter aestuarii]|uniref:prolyl hydroxylase family protein n=1 Tax=Parerythrobacter aestuarii TaxID=3020909 RepID=UPI0024DE3363|nr:2OG-Fe(II) oxygenase [Parerythrobacter aestuarii]